VTPTGLVTHSQTIARWAERRLVMHDGRLSERDEEPAA
jgi:hypothetical protein